MDKFTQILPFVQDLFDDRGLARKAARIVTGMQNARSPRISEIAREMGGNARPDLCHFDFLARSNKMLYRNKRLTTSG